MKTSYKLLLALAAITSLGFRASADVVTGWNANTEQAILTAAQGPPVQGRFLAIVHAAIYDAVNGIEHNRNSCNVGAEQGMKISSYVLENFQRPLRGHHPDEDDDVRLRAVPPPRLGNRR